MLNLSSLKRNTRGQNSREVEFMGIVTEVPAVSDNGAPALDKKGEPTFVQVALNTLPSIPGLIQGISEVLKNVDEDIRLVLSKTYNAVAFSAAVEATAATVVDLLTPMFAEHGITDEAEITKLRRSATMFANNASCTPVEALDLIFAQRAKAGK